MRRKIFVIHFCKNKNCNNAWLDEDLTNAKSRPPRWKYCEECCKKLGFNNSKAPPKKEITAKQLETIQKNKFKSKEKEVL